MVPQKPATQTERRKTMQQQTFRWIKVEGNWEPARELADGSFMPIGDIVPLAPRDVKVGPVIEPPPKIPSKDK